MSLRIGLLCHRGVGGSARIAVQLGNELAGRGHSVHLFARTRPLGSARFAPGVTFHPLREGDGVAPPSSALDASWSAEEVEALALRVASVARSRGLDVLHFHYALPFAAVASEARRRLDGDAPVVVGTLHGTDVTEARASLARSLGETDALTTVSRPYVALAESRLGLSRGPELIPNFVDVERFRPAIGNGDGHPGRPLRVVHVSNFRPVKDPVAVARVFARVRREVDSELWLVGDGEAMPSVRSAIGREGLAGVVQFFGLHPSVEEVLPHTDVLLITSRAESFCLAALEAAACGVPTVGPRVGGLPEVVADGETGFLFRQGDEEEAAGALLRLLTDRVLRQRMGAEAARRARRFSTDAMISRYEALYRRLLDAPARVPALKPA